MTTIEELIGRRVRMARTSAHLTQKDVAARLSETLGRTWYVPEVSKLEQGGRAITAAELAALTHVLGVNVVALTTPIDGETTVQVGVSVIPWEPATQTAADLDRVRALLGDATSTVGDTMRNLTNLFALLDAARAAVMNQLGGKPADTPTPQDDVLRAIFGEAEPAAEERESNA